MVREQGGSTRVRTTTKQPKAATVAELQAQLDRFASYYTHRPHRALGRRTPAAAFTARPKATPARPGLVVLRFVDRLPRNSVGKLLRTELRALASPPDPM